MKKDYIKVFVVLFVLILGGVLVFNNKDYFLKFNKESSTSSVLETASKEGADSFSYNGKSGMNALALLKEKAEVEQDNTGMVVSINGRKADKEKREFWSFYVDGVQASMGSADYNTGDSDIIDWKIENY